MKMLSKLDKYHKLMQSFGLHFVLFYLY